MAALTDYTENQIINHIFRTASYTPPTNLHFAFLSGVTNGETGAVSEFSFTNGYARVSMARNITNFSRTGQTVKNAVAITFNAPSGAWGTATHWGIYDQPTGGNLLAYGVLDASKVIGASSPAPEWPINAFTFNFTYTTNYLAQIMADWLFRGVAFTKPTSLSFALFTTAPTAAGGGIEVSGGAYSRASVIPADTAFDATVSGDGHTQNTNAILFPAPVGASWGTVVAAGVYIGTNLITYGSFTGVTVNNGDAAPSIAVGNFDYTIG